MGSKQKTSRLRSPSPPPDRSPYIFFADRDLAGKTFLQSLRAAGLAVESFHDHFDDPTTADRIWIRRCGLEGWVGLTHDTHILNCVDVAAEAAARVIVLRGAVSHPQLAANFINSIARVERYLRHTPAPFFVKLHLPAGRELKKREPRGSLESWWKKAVSRPSANP